MIDVRDLVKAYDGLRAVDGLSFRVEAGQILGLLGPNGAGKTTTLRCLSGIVPPTSGTIALGGFDLLKQPIEAKQRLGFVPDAPHLFEHLTVQDHVALIARVYGVRDGAARGDALLEQAGLAGRRLAFPSELSRGMQQKLVVACALLHRPEVLVLDEPLTGLDPAAMRTMKRTILETAEGGAAVLLSSHLLSLVEEVCDRVLIINHGRTVLRGTFPEIRAQVPNAAADASLEALFLKVTGAEWDESP